MMTVVVGRVNFGRSFKVKEENCRENWFFAMEIEFFDANLLIPPVSSIDKSFALVNLVLSE